jgi:hypothetical protein
MPQVLLIAAVGAGLLLVRRWLRREQQRVAADLRAAKEAMERRNIDQAVPLEQDPATGIYRPKHKR